MCSDVFTKGQCSARKKERGFKSSSGVLARAWHLMVSFDMLTRPESANRLKLGCKMGWRSERASLSGHGHRKSLVKCYPPMLWESWHNQSERFEF
ncbi:unnamed protein product [Allacma fusca]|uniref:Uncharacterized protein n=1 Tax=Allacma fusca TaxID=39272 RepID=A0A8J2KI08_9HEXA|nr:unnamed protein product [Allacma fusca]